MISPCKIPPATQLHGRCPDCGHVVLAHIIPTGECSICDAVEELKQLGLPKLWRP